MATAGCPRKTPYRWLCAKYTNLSGKEKACKEEKRREEVDKTYKTTKIQKIGGIFIHFQFFSIFVIYCFCYWDYLNEN